MKEIKLTKPRAKTEIIFNSDKSDEWLIWIHRVEKKSGKKTSSLIIQKDMEEFLTHYLNKGWIIFDSSIPIEPKKELKTKKEKLKKVFIKGLDK